MNKDVFDILKDEERIREIRKIAKKYGMRLTSTVLMSICILLTSGSSYRKVEAKIEKMESLHPELMAMSSKVINFNPFSVILNNAKFSYDAVREPTFEEKINSQINKLFHYYNFTQYLHL